MELMLATTPVNYSERLPLCLLQRHELRGSRAPHKTRQWSRCRASGAAAQQAKSDYRQRDARDVRVVVFGATGYIGKCVVKELVKRGYNVVAFAREKSGIGGKQSTQDVQKVRQPLSSEACSRLPGGVYACMVPQIGYGCCGWSMPILEA